MFADLDETIRQLLITQVPIDLTEVDLSFEAPDREWSGRLSRPTVNCFLYDVRENLELRQTDWEVQKKNGSASSKRLPARIDATYQVTVWARAPEDEHRLLWRVLTALFRHPILPEDLLQGQLRDQHFPTRVMVAQPSQARANPAELWQALDNRIRPALSYTVTVPLDSDRIETSPLVFTTRSRVIRGLDPTGPVVAEGLKIVGHVRKHDEPELMIEGAVVRLNETGVEYTTEKDGRFTFNVHDGPITLVARMGNEVVATRQVEVPAPEYDLEV